MILETLSRNKLALSWISKAYKPTNKLEENAASLSSRCIYRNVGRVVTRCKFCEVKTIVGYGCREMKTCGRVPDESVLLVVFESQPSNLLVTWNTDHRSDAYSSVVDIFLSKQKHGKYFLLVNVN